MTDQRVTPKLPINLDWSRGETDGEIREGFFYQLKNVELDRVGIVRTRDNLQAMFNYGGYDKIRYINADPSGDHSDGWFIGLDDNYIWLFPANSDGPLDSDASRFAWTISDVDPAMCEIAIHGSNIYIATKDSDGEPLGIVQVVYQNERTVFRAPTYVGISDPEYMEDTVPGGWYVADLNAAKPKVRSYYVKGFAKMRAIRRDGIFNIVSYLNSPDNEEYGVGFMVEPVLNESGKFGENTTLEYVLQFVFSNGSISVPSDPIRVEINYDEDQGDSLPFDTNRYKIATQIMVSNNINQMVKGVRVFRRVVVTSFEGNEDNAYSSPSHELVAVAWLDENELSPADEEYGYGFDDPSDQLYSIPSVYNDEKGQWYSINLPGWGYINGDVYHMMDADVKKTSGWVKVSGNVCVFQVDHLFRDGTCNIKTGDIGSGGMIGYDVTTVEILRTIGNLSAPCEILGTPHATVIGAFWSGGQKVIGVHQENSSPYNINFWDMDYLHLAGLYKLNSASNVVASYPWDIGDPDTTSVTGLETEGGNAALSYFSDNLDPAIQSLQQEVADLDQVSDVKPRYIGIAGSRLFALNVIKDGINMPSLLMYSEFSRPGIFLKNNVIPYGAKDDGEGVAISTSMSYVFAHHTSATYILDISGGSDFAWRELGAYSGIDCIKQDLATSTPAGPMWCGTNYVYWFNGNIIIPISREIIDRYRSATSSFDYIHFKEDLRQLWICYGSEVRVLDIDTNAWHYHNFEEFGSGYTIVDIMMIGTDQYIVIRSPVGFHYVFKFIESINGYFEWGLDTGWYDYSDPKFVKKAKRIYYEVERDYDSSNTPMVLMTSEGSVSGSISNFHELEDDGMVRKSASVRGYKIRSTVTIEAGNFWKGKIKNLGLSYKLKKLK